MNASFKLMLYGCVIYVCCVSFTSIDIVCDELNEPGSHNSRAKTKTHERDPTLQISLNCSS